MEYSEYREQAAEYMRLVIPLMTKYEIAMTPANYAVWYEYVSGNNVALTDVVDKHVEEHGRLTDKQSSELYQQFFQREKDQTAILEMRQDLRRVLDEVLGYVTSNIKASSQTTEELDKSLSKLHPDMSREQVHSVIEEILTETRLVLASGHDLTERLNSAMAEMQNLKDELDDTKRQAKTDALTKLANRNAFDQVMSKVTEDADNQGLEVCLIFCDLDSFKQINDKHGHIIGDQVLKVVATTLKNAVKGRDLVARYGGEEFTIVLLNTNLDNAKKLAENIRKEIASKRIQRKDTREPLGTITMSLGVARYVPSEGIESFMQRADRALYMSKRKGRNTVSEAPPPII